MYKQFHRGLAALALSALCTSTVAQDRTGQHNLGSGPDIYRVEVRNLNRFEVLEAGDSDGVGELHRMTVELRYFDPQAGQQYDRLTYTGTELYLINEGGIVGGDRYFPVRVGQHVFTASDRRPNDTTQMWVHANTDRSITSEGAGRQVYLTISAQDLDCVGQRVCGRRSNGSVTIAFEVPEFSTRPSIRCGPDNTFQLGPVDGELQIIGLPSTTVFSNANSESWFLGVDHDRGGPRLRPFNADICIASTFRP